MQQVRTPISITTIFAEANLHHFIQGKKKKKNGTSNLPLKKQVLLLVYCDQLETAQEPGYYIL